MCACRVGLRARRKARRAAGRGRGNAWKSATQTAAVVAMLDVVSIEMDVLHVNTLSLPVLLDRYVRRGIPVKLEADEHSTTWLRTLQPLLSPSLKGAQPPSPEISATAATLPPLLRIDGVNASAPRTIYAAVKAGYQQANHVDELCQPSYALGLNGAKQWTFQYDTRDDDGSAVEMETPAFEVSNGGNLTPHRRRCGGRCFVAWLPLCCCCFSG